MPFEEQTDIEQGGIQQTPMFQEQGDEQPSDPAIAIQIGMDRLELHVKQPCADERRELILSVDVLFKRARAFQFLTEAYPAFVK